MRRANSILTVIILVLFVAHGVLGAYNMMGIGRVDISVLTWTMVSLICAHMVIGIILTVRTLAAQRTAGVSYPKENRLFWARRISGFAVMILIFFHVGAMSTMTTGGQGLPEFGAARLAAQILLVISIGVHVITNARPMLMSFGVKHLRPRSNDIAFVISVLLLLMAAGFVIYFIRWIAV